MAALARRIQHDRVAHSAETALLGDLLREIPAPVMLLGPDLGVREMNILFRETVGVEMANLDSRVHEITHSAEFSRAAEEAARTLEAQPLRLNAGGRRPPAELKLCPLPGPQGALAWGVVGRGERPGDRVPRRLIQQVEATLSSRPARTEGEAEQLRELRELLRAIIGVGPAAEDEPQARGG